MYVCETSKIGQKHGHIHSFRLMKRGVNIEIQTMMKIRLNVFSFSIEHPVVMMTSMEFYK
jgi:hypothetical protein